MGNPAHDEGTTICVWDGGWPSDAVDKKQLACLTKELGKRHYEDCNDLLGYLVGKRVRIST